MPRKPANALAFLPGPLLAVKGGALKAADIVTRDMVALASDATLQEAAQLMREHDTGFIPVAEGRKLIGAVTDRDIALRGVADNRDAAVTPIRDVMSPECQSCSQDISTEEAAHLMGGKQIRRLPVTDETGNLVGVVSLGDLAARAKETEDVGEAMEDIAKPTGKSRSL